ncbi:MAG: hypothetical protein NZ455_06650 [Bacteroidia bacterium]|nr:hypothetical protein [Bacteroidia bacterium]MDW8345715.1 hypothetical protein [Bacteroidia bacterium]
MRQHGAKPPVHALTLAQGVGRSTVSPQHADLVGMSAAKRTQGHAQKTLVSGKEFLLVLPVKPHTKVNVEIYTQTYCFFYTYSHYHFVGIFCDKPQRPRRPRRNYDARQCRCPKYKLRNRRKTILAKTP